MAQPLVSVLLPVRNGRPTLAAAVRSILAQTYPRLELWIIDDGSTDGSGRAADDLAGRDPRVRVVHADATGLPRALERGRSLCRGELIARMDADDESLPERLERSVEALEQDPTLWAVGTQVEIFRDDRPVSPNMQGYARWLNGLTTPERLAKERFIDAPLCHPSATIRREALEAVGGFSDNEYAEDYQLWLQMLQRGGRLKAVCPTLFRWRDQPHRLTRVDPRYSPQKLVALKSHHAAMLVPEGGSAVVWGATTVGLALFRGLASRGARVEALIDVSARKVGQRVDGVPVLDPAGLKGPNGRRTLFAAVGAKGAREQILAFAAERGYRDGADLFAVC